MNTLLTELVKQNQILIEENKELMKNLLKKDDPTGKMT